MDASIWILSPFRPLRSKIWKRTAITITLSISLLIGLQRMLSHSGHDGNRVGDAEVVVASQQSFVLAVHLVGELAAFHSTTLTSALRGDRGKLIELIIDGSTVQAGDILATLDPTPFEDRIEELKVKIDEQQANIQMLHQALDWEQGQVDSERRTAQLDYAVAELDLQKVIHGDGPLEEYRLRAAKETAHTEYCRLLSYLERIESLVSEHFFNATELELARSKVQESKRALHTAESQYDSYATYVQPMRLQAAQAHLERVRLRLDEVCRHASYRIEKARSAIEQAQYGLTNLQQQLQRAERDLEATRFRAPSSGIVVYKEGFFQGERRKPRLGDMLVQNQPLFEIPDLSVMIVKTRVRESELHKIALKQACIVRIDAVPELALEGSVIQLGVLALRDQASFNGEKWFELTCKIHERDPRLRPGMTARVQVLTQEVKDELCLPVHALFLRSYQTICFVDREGQVVRQPVTVGAISDFYAVIKSGLNAGDRCLVIPPEGEDLL